MLDDIRKEIGKPNPKSKNILKILYQLGKNAKSQKIKDTEFFDAIGEIFRLNPEFFMNELYPLFMAKMAKIIGIKRRREMERYIIEKFCLLGDERIIYELEGNITQKDFMEQKESGKYKPASRPVTILISSGDIFLTNHRLIAHGLLEVVGGRSFWAVSWRDFVPTWRSMLNPWVKQKRRKPGSKAKQKKADLVDSNPTFGFQFPTKKHNSISKARSLFNKTKYTLLMYTFHIDKLKCFIFIEPTDKKNRNEHIHALFDILCRDAS